MFIKSPTGNKNPHKTYFLANRNLYVANNFSIFFFFSKNIYKQSANGRAVHYSFSLDIFIRLLC